MVKFTKDSTAFTPMSFVAKAVAGPKTAHGNRVVLKDIYCAKDGRIMGCDGDRLHIYKPEESILETGFYEIIKRTKTELVLDKIGDDGLFYPDIDIAIPDYKSAVDFTSLGAPERYAQLTRHMAAGCVLYDYFIDALAGDMTAFQSGEVNSPVVLLGEAVKAVIMPRSA